MNYDEHLNQLWRKQERRRHLKHRWFALRDLLSDLLGILGGLVAIIILALFMWFISGQLK